MIYKAPNTKSVFFIWVWPLIVFTMYTYSENYCVRISSITNNGSMIKLSQMENDVTILKDILALNIIIITFLWNSLAI